MLQAGAGSGGGASPAGGGGGGDVARNLAGQVKALRSRVEELLERARDAEVGGSYYFVSGMTGCMLTVCLRTTMRSICAVFMRSVFAD